MKTHLTHLKERYQPPIVLVNLINQRGAEAVLFRALSSYTLDIADPDVKLVNWDFHHHCRKMQWHNVQLLLDDLSGDLDRIGYYDSTTSTKQRGIVRTNCIDCLDRTNVVQSLIAKRQLQQVFTKWSIPATTETDTVFKHLWADNADAISHQYSGTGALKTDYTRTGQRTWHGQYRDLVNSITRYLKGNLTDADRQDAMDLFFGAYSVFGGGRPVEDDLLPHHLRIMIPLMIILVTVVLIVKSILSDNSPISPLPRPLAILFLSACVAVVVKVVVWRGSVFVRLPRFNPPPVMVVGRGEAGRERARPIPGHKAHII